MPADNQTLRDNLSAVIPSLVIDNVAKESGQRVVYFAHFDDSLIPADLSPESNFLRDWQNWGDVVLKVSSGNDATSLTRLQREIELLKEFDSLYFPKLLFSGIFTENPLTEAHLQEKLFITVEERVDSVPLSAIMGQYDTEDKVVSLLLKLFEALDLLWTHQKRLVHRDLKPDNILIRPNGNVVIIDLGIIRESGTSGITNTGMPFGPMTINYAAPEQTLNDKNAISFKTDFFALGIIAYQLLSGAHPFCISPNQPAMETMTNIQSLNPPSLHSLGVATPEFSFLVERLLEKLPYRRFRTPGMVMNALNSLPRSE